MKHTCVAVMLVAVTMAGGISRGGELSDHVGAKLRKYCDPSCALQSQDQAFSLLIETFRQFESQQIESDYQARLRAASSLGDGRGSLVIESRTRGMQTLRAFVLSLAKQEHDLRMQELETKVVNFRSAYNCARKQDEQAVGLIVPNKVDTRVAADRLKDFVILSRGPLATTDLRQPQSVPLSAVLYDAPPATPFESQIIEPCE
jgi:hypothetical protein